LTVNLEAPFLLGQRFAPGMASRGYGRLIHISSQQAHRSFVDSGVYGVSKGGLESLARSQSEAWSARGVTANTLVPGFVLTPLNQRLQDDADTIAALAARTTVGRNGVPEDFAGAAVFLASAASGYVTGHSLFVDGGFSVHCGGADGGGSRWWWEQRADCGEPAPKGRARWTRLVDGRLREFGPLIGSALPVRSFVARPVLCRTDLATKDRTAWARSDRGPKSRDRCGARRGVPRRGVAGGEHSLLSATRPRGGRPPAGPRVARSAPTVRSVGV